MTLLRKLRHRLSNAQTNNVCGLALRQNGSSLCYSETSGPAAASCHELQLQGSQDHIEGLTALLSQQPVSGQCLIMLAPHQYHVVQVDLPRVPKDEIRDALKWQVKDLVPIEPDDMVLDYTFAPIKTAGVEKVSVYCASIGQIKPIVETVSAHGVTPIGITTEEFAFANLLPHTDDATILLCQQPGEEASILIIKQGQIYFSRRLRGYSQLADKSQEELMLGIIDALSLEVQRSTDFFERQMKQGMIREIKLLLPVDTEQFIAGELGKNTSVPVSALTLPFPFQANRRFGAAIGAMLDHQQGVDG